MWLTAGRTVRGWVWIGGDRDDPERDLLAARAAGEKADIRRLVESVTVELKVVATSGREGKAGFRVPFVDLELGGSLSRQAEQTSSVTVVFGAPVDKAGNPVRVAEGSDHKGRPSCPGRW